MVEANDWRLRNQQTYLHGVSLVHRAYQPLPGNDHDHCAFCWAKFMLEDSPKILHEGYATLDSSHWICDQCFDDFGDMFDWKLSGDGTSQI